MSKEPPPTTTTEIRARPTEVAQSPRDETSSIGIVRKIVSILMTIGICRTRRKEMVPTNLKVNPMVMVRLHIFPVIILKVMFQLFLLHVLLMMMNGYSILLLWFFCNKDWFSSYEFVHTGDFVHVGDDTACQIDGVGSVQIKTSDGMTRMLTGVKHIPTMARNLISLSTLDSKAYTC
jgi:hypothetical protein